MKLMTTCNSYWPEFIRRLQSLEGCNLHQEPDGRLAYDCDHQPTKRHAVRILLKMGWQRRKLARSCRWFEDHGADCDCQILSQIAGIKLEN